jgi:hypothetical protein
VPQARLRPIANGAFLRKRALENVCAAKGVRVPAEAEALGPALERARGIAVEGIGASGLRREFGSEQRPRVVFAL